MTEAGTLDLNTPPGFSVVAVSFAVEVIGLLRLLARSVDKLWKLDKTNRFHGKQGLGFACLITQN